MMLNIEKINRRRVELNISMSELAKLMQYSRGGLYNAFQNSEKVNLEFIEHLANALKMDSKDLLE